MDYSKTPIEPPPPGVSSNFISPESRGNVFVGVSGAFLALMLSFIVLRMWTKVVIMKAAGWDDVSSLLAMAGQCAYFAMVFDLKQHGIGRHVWDVPRSMFIPRVAKELHVIAVITQPVVFFAKLSLFLLYHRLFWVAKDLRYAIFLGIGINFIIYTVIMFGFIFITKDQEEQKMSYTIGAVNVVSDLYILILPIVAVSRLQLSLKKKVGVIAIFFTGSFACIVSVIGLVYRVELRKNGDVTWRLIPVYTAGSVELNVGIICSCLPILPPFYRAYNPLRLPFYSSLRSRLRSSWVGRTFSGSGGTSSHDLTPRGPVERRYIDLDVIEQHAKLGNRNDNLCIFDNLSETGRHWV